MKGYVLPDNVHYYRNRDRKNVHGTMAPVSRILDVTLTPDFTWTDDSRLVVIECKGFPNDVYPYKVKAFLRAIKDVYDEVWFFEVKTVGQLTSLLPRLQELTGKKDVVY